METEHKVAELEHTWDSTEQPLGPGSRHLL